MSLSLAAILAESALRCPDRTAVILGSDRVTYGDLWDQSRGYAAALADLGVGRGDRVALLVPNVPDFPRSYYAILSLGAVVVPVHALLTAEEIAYALTDSSASLLICAAPLLGEGAKGAELAGVPIVSVLAGEESGAPRLEDLAREIEPIGTYRSMEPHDDAVILYTSGTTGQPKGAVLSHLNLVLNATLTATDIIGLTADDVVLGCLPLFHSFGQTCAMNAGFRVGAALVLMPRFDGPGALDLLLTHGVTVFEGVPTMYLALLDAAAADPRRPQLRMAVSGGAPLPAVVMERFADTFGGDVYEGYGLSETSPVATFNQAVFGRRPGTVGCAIWGVDVAVVRPEVEERLEFVAAGEIGEIVIRGHNIMTGYYRRPEATAAAIVDGWLRTGDLGTKDADGFVTIVDRKKDMVLRGGFSVYPREIEEVLARHPAVGRVAVIGVPDAMHGEEVCAVVALTPSAATQPEDAVRADLDAFAQAHLGRHKYPRRYVFATELPLGPSGKILKRELVSRYREDPIPPPAAAPDA